MKKLIFRVDVGNLPKARAEEYMKGLLNSVKQWRGDNTSGAALVIPDSIEVLEVDI